MLPDALRGAKRVLVVRLDNIGDVLLTSPLVRALDAALPGAELTLLASPGGALAAPLLPWFDRTITRRAVWQDLGNRLPFDPADELGFISELRSADYDAAIICTSFSQTPFAAAYALYLAGVPVRIAQAADFGGSVLSHAIEPAPAGAHQAERNLRLLDAIGVPIEDRRTVIRVPAAARDTAARLLGDIGAGDGDAIVVAPGASCASRRYDPARYGRAADELHRATRRPVVVVGTEREAALADAFLAECPAAHSLVGRTSVPELAAVVERAGLVLCGNSATLHLADALDRPVVALYSGTDRESEWAPRSAPATLLRIETSCAPCRRFDCPYEMACLAIPPDVVVDAALRLLGTTVEEGRWLASAS